MITLVRENVEEFIKNRIYRQDHIDVAAITETLSGIKKAVLETGDEALNKYTKKFDGVSLDGTMAVSKEEIKAAYDTVDPAFIKALEKARENILAYHKNQRPENWNAKPGADSEYGAFYTPIESVGLYVPGGRAPYPSTVLMDALPAKIAGVENLVIVSPPTCNQTIHPSILVAADICGVDTVFKVGGAQAVFALAFGTQTVPKMDKIVGPGNMYVTVAKQMVYGAVDIDKPAGPSDVLIYGSDKKYVTYAAADVLSQLEHGPDSMAIVVSEEEEFLELLNKEIQVQIKHLKRKDNIEASLRNSFFIHSKSKEDSIKWINQSAAEHVVLLLDSWRDVLARIKNGGSIFCGPYTPVTLGDYFAGPNHVLPTGGAARFSSPLGVMDYMKYSSYLWYSREALSASASHIEKLTEQEGFGAHNEAVQKRIRS